MMPTVMNSENIGDFPRSQVFVLRRGATRQCAKVKAQNAPFAARLPLFPSRPAASMPRFAECAGCFDVCAACFDVCAGRMDLSFSRKNLSTSRGGVCTCRLRVCIARLRRAFARIRLPFGRMRQAARRCTNSFARCTKPANARAGANSRRTRPYKRRILRYENGNGGVERGDFAVVSRKLAMCRLLRLQGHRRDGGERMEVASARIVFSRGDLTEGEHTRRLAI